MMSSFASRECKLDFAEVAMHVSDGFGAQFFFRFHNDIPEVLSTSESASTPRVHVRPVYHELGLLYFFADRQNLVKAAELAVSAHRFGAKLNRFYPQRFHRSDNVSQRFGAFVESFRFASVTVEPRVKNHNICAHPMRGGGARNQTSFACFCNVFFS